MDLGCKRYNLTKATHGPKTSSSRAFSVLEFFYIDLGSEHPFQTLVGLDAHGSGILERYVLMGRFSQHKPSHLSLHSVGLLTCMNIKSIVI